jgi:hypothetical protein
MLRAAGLLVVGSLVIAACGGDDDSSSSSSAATTGARGQTTTSAAAGTTTSAAGGTTTSAGASGGQLPAYAATLQEAIPKVMEENAIPGVVVLIRSKDQGDWSATFGTAELGKGVPMTIDDHFRIGSNTKTMTSTVILQLVQEGKLALDDPIGKFRPDVPNGENITIQQLAEMLERAGATAADEAVGNVTFLRGDAQTYPFPAAEYDVAISRFGIMFSPTRLPLSPTSVVACVPAAGWPSCAGRRPSAMSG